jgi:phage terminase small subunit
MKADILAIYNKTLYNNPFTYILVIYLYKMKLTRKDIKQGLQDMPIDTLLLGSPKTLTHKQKAFAEALAKTGNKAEAYRQAYNTNSSPKIQSQEGQNLAKNPIIALQVEAIKLGLEAQKYLLPAHLRALTIQKLTEKAIDPEVKPAQQLKALELLGKITEVALFTERKEITTNDTSAKAKDKLINTLAQAIRSSKHITEAKKKEADDLLQEITGGNLANPEPDTIDQEPEDNIDQDITDEAPSILEAEDTEKADNLTPPPPDRPILHNSEGSPMHTIPDKQSDFISEAQPLSFTESEWGGVDNFWKTFEKVDTETPPLSNLNENEDKNI